MTFCETLDRVALETQDFFGLLEALHARRFTGAVILHCVEGQPKMAEFPSLQVRLRSKDLTSAESSLTLSLQRRSHRHEP